MHGRLAVCRYAGMVAAFLVALGARPETFGPHELDVQVDVRLVAADTSLESFTQGGLGLLRFDESQEGVQLGRVLIDYLGPISGSWRAHIALSATDDGDKNPLDVTEAYVEWRPPPSSWVRWRARVGAFYPPISLENRGIGWQSLYSLSPSAINTWVGEEIRTIGAELNVTAGGAQAGRSYDVGAVVGAYGWNDPMGVLIFQRGWAVHDRQTALFGRLPAPLPRGTTRHGLEFFHEIDDRPGYYAGLEFRYLDRIVLRGLHYDNRGDPAAFNGRENAWLSRFDAIGLRLELPQSWTVIAQWMGGDTGVGSSADGRGRIILDYWSDFLLLSKSFGRHRVTLRYDRLHTDTVRGAQFVDSYQSGHAWTLAYIVDATRRWQFAIEGIKNVSELGQRERLDLPENVTEQTVQLALRYTL